MGKHQDTSFITGIRMIAVLMVYLIHSGIGHNFSNDSYWNDFFSSGKYGVQIFFVISGFTIFYQFYHSGYSFKRYVFVRLLRISLGYYPVLMFVLILSKVGLWSPNYWLSYFDDGSISIVNVLMHFSYLGFWDPRYLNTVLGVEWTLYVEVFFYIVLGIFIKKISLKDSLVNLIIVLVFFACLLFFSIYLVKMSFINEYIYGWSPLRYGFFFILGGGAYIVRYKNFRYKQNFLSNICTFVFFVCVFFAPLINSAIVRELAYAVATFLIISFGSNDALMTSIFNTKVFQFLGSISFSIYLTHGILISFGEYIVVNDNVRYFITFLFVLIFSKAYSMVFEEKFYRNIKSKF